MAKKILLFLAQGFEVFEACIFIEVFGWSKEPGFIPVDLKITGLRPVIKSNSNLMIHPDVLFDTIDVNDYDALAIPGGVGDAGFYKDAYDERFLNLIRAFDKKEKWIASVSVGALPVGKSGVLKNRRATTWNVYDGFRRKQLADFGVEVQDSPFVVDRNIITSTEPATCIDVALLLLERLTDIHNVKSIKIAGKM
jgi:protein deglycase